jgi:ABC-type uncharacterized transport system permease subunit
LEKIQPTVAPKAGAARSGEGRKPTARRGALLQTILIPLLAVLTGLIIGAIVIIVTDAAVVAAFGKFFQAPGTAFAAAWKSIATAYGALFRGSFGSLNEMLGALGSGDPAAIRQAFWPITESLVASTPYIFTGLAVGLGFKAGLFNIGAEGQFFMGSLGAAFIGYSLIGWPWYLHLPLAIVGGFFAGAIWGAIPGWLKAKTGGHEVVNTIMMNWIGFRLSDWLLNGPMKAPGFRPVTPQIESSAALPRLFGDPLRFNVGFFLALIVAGVVFWLLFKTTIGFTIRAVGANPDAARYSGMSITRTIVLAMTLSGGLAGLAGASQVLGVDHWVGQGFSAGYGFDAIAIALLGKSHPFGIVLAALLFGFLRSGATRMQSLAGIPIDIISIIQGLVIVFVAAPDIIRWLYRLRNVAAEKVMLSRGWGS